MFGLRKFHKNESGQTALETAIILIAFVVVASVFAFTILSAGSASTERGEQAIYSGLENVQASMQTVGAVIAEAASNEVTDVRFTVQLANGNEAVPLDDILVSYRDATQIENLTVGSADFALLGGGTDNNAEMLEPGERYELTVDLAAVNLGPNTAFTLEVKPPTGAVLAINRTTPAALDLVNELR